MVNITKLKISALADMLGIGRLRRTLLACVLVFTCVFTYLYWNQVKENVTLDAIRVPNVQLRNDRETEEPRFVSKWTWICANNHCERREQTKDLRGMTLITCNMLCGSTQLWPQPTGPVTLASHSLAFTPDQLSLIIQHTKPNKKLSKDAENLILEAFDLFRENVNKTMEAPSPTEIESFEVNVKLNSSLTKLTLSTNESYSLHMYPLKTKLFVQIHAENFFGARHALETLWQLVWFDKSLRVLKAASIKDEPRFAYRGLLIDTSRNYFSIEAIQRTVDAMAANKLNVLHWHISDSQSFPFDAPSVPQMALHGAYDARKVYTANDIKTIVHFSKVRGVRVVIEIDSPAHVGMGWTWGPQEGLGTLAVCVGQQPWSNYCGEPPCGQLNPLNENVYQILQSLYADIFRLTEETELFHIGGDEVNLECWSQFRGTSVMNFNYTDLNEMWGNFTLKALASARRANNNQVPSRVIIWSSGLTKPPYNYKYLDTKTFVVQTWGSSTWPETLDLLDSNYHVILSHVDAWYLDCGFGRWREIGDAACDPYRPWQSVYAHRPWQSYSRDKLHLILGAEACLWTEQVSELSLDTRLWPRAAAFSERVWSDVIIDGHIVEDTYTRLNTHSERLLRRGVRVESMWPKWCEHNPGMCL